MLLMALQHLLEQLDLHFIMGFGLMMDGNYLLGFILSQAICDNMMSTALLNSNKGHHPQHSEKKRTKLFYSFVFKNDILQTACILSQITCIQIRQHSTNYTKIFLVSRYHNHQGPGRNVGLDDEPVKLF